MSKEGENTSKVQAGDNSIVVGSLSVGRDVSGNVHIGHTIGYTAEQVSLLINQITTTFKPKPFDGRCPYKGLDVFEEEDAELFFGREKLVEDLVERVRESRTLFITGPSGSGKSSLVRAGLLYALRGGALKGLHSERWLYETMKPGRDPLGELARIISGLARSTSPGDEVREKGRTDPAIFARWCEVVLKEGRDKRLVLFIDQFEEVFTQLSREEERAAFLNLLTHAARVEDGRVIILFAMRSDFLSNCATYPELNALLNRQFVQIGAMGPHELVSAIAQPALRVGLEVRPELIAQIINDMKGEPGALPLMQFALKDLFDALQAKGGLIALRLEDYLERGGLDEALQRHADHSLAKLDKDEQELARSIFSGLIEIGRGTQDTRRTAHFDELVPADVGTGEIHGIVRKLADARLITTDEQSGKDTVTISHEKLIEAWPWLKKLVNENRDVIALQNDIASDAKEWEEHKRDASYLYSGARLVNANEQLKTNRLVLSGTALEYIRAGRARQRRSRFALIGTTTTIIALLALAVLVFRNQSILNASFAQQNASSAATAQAASKLAFAKVEEAQEQANIALARQLAAQAQSIYAPSSQEVAVLLSLRSMQLFPVIDAAQIIQTSTITHSIAPMTHDGFVTSVAFSPDGKYVVSGSGDGTARVWNAANGKEIARMAHDTEVTSVAFSPDGKYVVSGSSDKTARVWEATTGKEVARMTHDDGVTSNVFNYNGNYVVSGSLDGTARVWEATTGREVARMTHGDKVDAVAFSPDGNYVISGGCDESDDNGNCISGPAQVWEITTGKKIASMGKGIISAAFSPNGKFIVSGSSDGSLCVWETTTGTEVFCEYVGLVLSVAFSPDGHYVVYGDDYSRASIWDFANEYEVAYMIHDAFGPGAGTRGSASVNSVAFSPDGRYVVSGSGDQSARVWEVDTGKEVARMTHANGVTAVAFSPDGKYVVSGDYDGIVRVWEATTGIEFTRRMGISFFAFSLDGRYAVWGGDDNTAGVREVVTGKDVARMTLDDKATSAAFSPDGKYVVIGDNRTAGVWEVATEVEVTRMPYGGRIISMAFSPDGKYVVLTGCDEDKNGSCILGSVRVWDVSSGTEVAYNNHNNGVSAAALSPDGKYVVSAGCDETNDNGICITGTARTWEAISGMEVSRMTHDDEVTSIAFSPDGKYVLSGSRDKTARVWEVATGKEVARMTDRFMVTAVAFSPGGVYVGSAGCNITDDGTADGICMNGIVRVWNAATGVEVANMDHTGAVDSLVFSANGKHITSGSHYFGEHMSRTWIYRPEDLIANGCSRVSRNLTRAEWKQYIGDSFPYEAVCSKLPFESEVSPSSTP